MPDDQQERARHVVLLGASAGGVEALSTVVSGLPHDLPAAVLVVLHVPAWGTSVLPTILDRCGKLPSRHAIDGERLCEGRIYVAPPDRHLTIEDGRVRLSRSPRENGMRPSIDTLFRSAAHSHQQHVVAVILSGALDDGTAGLVSVKQHGGVTIVQEPSDALFPSMPDSAMRFARPTHVVPAHEVAALVATYVTVEPDPSAEETSRGNDGGSGGDSDGDVATRPEDTALSDGASVAATEQEETPSGLNCPECGGTLWERLDGDLLRFRCRVGHAYSPESLFSQQLESLEGALWAAVVALQERADLATRLAHRMSGRAQHERAIKYERQARDARRRAEQVRAAIIQLSRSDERTSEEEARDHNPGG